MNCGSVKRNLIAYVYEELKTDDRKKFENHLKECPKCAVMVEETRGTLGVVDRYERPEISANLENLSWKEMKLSGGSSEKSSLPSRLLSTVQNSFHMPSPAAMMKGAALILAGLFIGWMVFAPSTDMNYMQTGQPDGTDLVRVSAEERANRVLDKSKVLLLGIANFDVKTEDASVLNLGRGRAMSAQLLKEVNYLKGELDPAKEARLRELITDLEFILVQLANMESENDIEGIEILQSGIENRGLMLKIDLNELDRINNSDKESNTKHNSNIRT